MTSHSTIQVSPRGFLAGRARRAVAAVAGALLLVSGAGVVAMTNAEAATPTLPFDLVQTSGSKVVFAHYFTPYPVSLDNADPASDYYARNYLNFNGESGKYVAYGGLLHFSGYLVQISRLGGNFIPDLIQGREVLHDMPRPRNPMKARIDPSTVGMPHDNDIFYPHNIDGKF